ncbi:hypothetical protein GCM10020254_06440 [Streptomyces goshikiensis]
MEVGERCDGRAGALPWRVDGRESPAGRTTGVHPSDSIDAALTHCFRVDNRTAPGELALLWLADRVEEGFQRYRAEHGIRTRWETREPIVVALRCEAASRAAPPARTDGARWLPGASNAARAAGRATAWRRSGAACASSGGRSPGRCRRQAWTTPRREAGAGLISRGEREEAYETLISAGQWMGGRYVEGARPRSGRTAGAAGCTDVPRHGFAVPGPIVLARTTVHGRSQRIGAPEASAGWLLDGLLMPVHQGCAKDRPPCRRNP